MKRFFTNSNFTKYDFLTVFIFLTGFLFSVLDLQILSFAELVIGTFSIYTFTITYILSFLFLLMTTKKFIKNGSILRLQSEYSKNNNIFKSIQLVLLGYYMGFIINISNAFIIVLFNKFIF